MSGGQIGEHFNVIAYNWRTDASRVFSLASNEVRGSNLIETWCNRRADFDTREHALSTGAISKCPCFLPVTDVSSLLGKLQCYKAFDVGFRYGIRYFSVFPIIDTKRYTSHRNIVIAIRYEQIPPVSFGHLMCVHFHVPSYN